MKFIYYQAKLKEGKMSKNENILFFLITHLYLFFSVLYFAMKEGKVMIKFTFAFLLYGNYNSQAKSQTVLETFLLSHFVETHQTRK